MRRRGYAYRTEQNYEQWICRFLLFCSNGLPEETAAAQVRAFLEHLAVKKRVSAGTRNQTL
ncbi:site-specific integrase [Thioalkalivibrio denitrificans]|uniref:site-specific integrase n=1 Tax=Thioalkalivibrio denitrificans TaxID=108003 RepID=UPI001FE4E166|nr:site-specific integrase [Thioalkalivibrio denitrificans]